MDNHTDQIIKRRSNLSAAKRAILEKRLRGKHQPDTQQIVIPRRTQHPIPLSAPQQRLWFLQQLEPESCVYNEFACMQLKGTLNVTALEKSLNEIVKRHESLRTCFKTFDEQPVQVICPSLTINLPVVDLSALTQALQDVEIKRLTAEIVQKPFDLTSAPLLRVMLLQTSEQEYLLLFVIHHIICDGWSIQVLNQELAAIYAAFSTGKSSPLSPLPIQYADYSIWQQQWLEGEREKTQLSYWQQQLADSPSSLSLPTDYQRPPVQSFQGAAREFELSPQLSERLRFLSKQQGATLFMTLLAAFQVLLYRYTSQEDICIGSPIANRNQSQIEGLIGFFVNTLALRTDLSGNPSFLELLDRVREVCIGAYQRAELPFERLVAELHPERNLSHTPLFQVTFALQSDTKTDLVLPDLTLKWLQNHSETAKFDLSLYVVDSQPQLRGWWEYNTDLFDATTVERMAGHLINLLEGIVAQPEKRLSELPLLTEAERQMLFDWNNTATNYPEDKCIHQLFEAQVEKMPNAVAVVFENQQLTYRQLNNKANQLARYLRFLGVKPEVLVGICVERSLDMLIGLLAILKAGAAYVPLDPVYPQERIAFILEETQAAVLLTQASLLETIPQHQARVVCLDSDWHLIAQQSQENLCSLATTDDLAYTIYTSGSTGKPKGVQITHGALSNFLYSMQQAPGLTSSDTLLAVTTYSFDIAALELFLPIIVGARLVIASREIISDGIRLSAKLMDTKATVMQATPATWQNIMAAGWHGDSQLKILCGGEALPRNLANQLLDKCHSLWNMYGPTETTIWSAVSQVQTGENIVPIGKPIANTQLYILDKYNQLAPVGVTGELCIGGKGLAACYFRRFDLTAEKFIPNPFSNFEGNRLYKTGDLARYLPSGNIEYIGRIDNQVKLRGFRIELGEIEAVIGQYPAVREAVVIIGENSANSQLIIAYVVVEKEQTLLTDHLRSFVESELPNYMVPAAFITLEALPLTANGKVDRKALIVPDLTQISSSDIVPPSTPVETLLAGIWAEILGIEKIGINHNFFELGGHSLIATRVISQIRQVFQVELPLRYLFETPTIAGLAKEIEKAIKVDSAVAATNIEPISRGQQLPISFAQQRLWFLTQLEPDSPFYNISAAVRLQGELNVEALQQSFNEIVCRHETLRTNFLIKEGQPLVIISEAKPLTLSILDISSINVNQQAEIEQQIAREAQQPFDISSDCLLRIKLLRLGEQEHIILVTMHHIVSDGWSIGILVKEFSSLYPIFCDKDVTQTALPPLPIQYIDFAAWQRKWLQGEILENQISYWLKQLENAPKVLELPTDYPRSKIQTFRGATYSFELSTELSAKLNKLSQQEGVTLFMTLLAGFQTLLYRYTAQEDIVVGSPIANRNRAEIEGLIGFFVNTLVLRTNLVGNPSFAELLKRVREVALGAYAHQNLPFELLVEKLQPQRDLSHTPLFQVMFVLENAPISALELPGLSLNFLESHSDSAKFDLTLYMAETESGIVGSLEYNTDLFEENTIQRMAAHLQTLFAGIVANPQQRLSELPLLTASEQHQLLVDWNDTQVEYSQYQSIHELFETQVEKTPDAVAVVFENQQLTYRELNIKANQLADYLRSLGVKPEVLVGICVERTSSGEASLTPLMVIGLLGILKAGGAYVPLDPNYPQQRLAFMLEDSQTPILLSQQHLVENLPHHKAQVICLDSDWDKIAHHNSENLTCNLNSRNLAYVIYTSGSTGKPKGAMNTHQGVCNRLQWMQDTYKLTTADRVLQKTPFSFDVSVWEFFWTLMTGACLIIAKPEGHRDSNYLVKLIKQQQITTLHFVPSMLQIFLDEPDIENCQYLKRVFCSGEALSFELQNKFFARCQNVELHNLYGPTEAAIDVTFWHCQPDNQKKIVPIGRPIANTQIYILDKELQIVPVGVPGELHIGGVGLARGYLNRPQLSFEKFIANPFSNQPGEKLYKTGDLARYLGNGTIEYLGRIDNQVKIRGFRIELGEIETVLQQIPEIKQAVVIVRDRSNFQRIVAYIVTDANSPEPEFEYLREFLQRKLPDYMIPSDFVVLNSLPLTPNGKLDYRALPAAEITLKSNHQRVLPRNPIENQLAEIWAQILQTTEISIDENFFELGGHSLLATQIMSKIRQTWQIELPLSRLFEMPTIALLSAEITKTLEQQEEKSIKAPQRLSRTARRVKLSSLNKNINTNN
ncbi:MAG: amino acid adenylation domain-containing protein [Rivularia sp. (in: cyanobacteria)]